jgi:hypothetical protein
VPDLHHAAIAAAVLRLVGLDAGQIRTAQARAARLVIAAD